jgi:urease accessory protein
VIAPDAPPKSPSTARLGFALVEGRTALIRAEAQSPLKLLQPRHAGSGGWACASNLGGGFVHGDAVSFEIEVGTGAKAALTTQASTKIYRGTAAQSLRAQIDGDGLLVAAPDPVVCYAAAGYRQEQFYRLSSNNAGLVVIDGLTSGRAARGERWDFSCYESRITIERAGKTELIDAVRLSPDDGAVRERLGRFEVVALAAVTGPALAEGARRLCAEISALPLGRRSPLVLSCSPFGADGVLLRLAAVSVEDAARELRRRLSFVWELLGDDPWSRRN